MKLVQGIGEIVDDFDVFVIDLWGVLIDGKKAYDGVLETIRQLHREANKRLIILSNSSRRCENSIQKLESLGFDPAKDLEQVVTSGEVAWQVLKKAASDPSSSSSSPLWPPLQKAAAQQCSAVVLGSGDDDDGAYLQECGWQLTTAEQATLILTRGAYTVNNNGTTGNNKKVDKRTDPDAYEAALQQVLKTCAARKVPMLVTNPDKYSPQEGHPPMPGQIGDRYEALLRQEHNDDTLDDASTLVKRIGKPFPDVYDWILEHVVDQHHHVDKTRVCMVGDTLETDVAGGSLAGWGTVWVVMDGIHRTAIRDPENLQQEAEQALADFNAKSATTYARGQILQPNYVMAHFRW